jgi:hypothetical protein
LEVEPGLVKIHIVNLIKTAASFAGIEVHVSIGAKLVKLNYPNEQFVDILRKLQQKDVTEVYILAEDCKKIIAQLQESLSSKTFYDPKTTDEERVESVDRAMATVKNIINQLGVDVETVNLLKNINAKAMTLLSESPTIFTFIKRFKKNCSEEFLRSILTSYVMSLAIDQFDWKSKAVKEKGALASLLCDLMLTKEDFDTLHSWKKPFAELPEHLRRHPIEIAEKLRAKGTLIPLETITIIEQHHEIPDGSGYPLKIDGGRFNLLSSIFIVSQQFIQELVNVDFDYDQRHIILNNLQKKYASGKSFEKALDSLVRVVGI